LDIPSVFVPGAGAPAGLAGSANAALACSRYANEVAVLFFPDTQPMLRSNTMLFESDKVMFEIYRETEYTGKYRVVYFTELQDHNKETEINHALAGEHFFDGFIKNFRKDEAKEIIDSILGRLNEGEPVAPDDIERALGEHMA
jgi:hypothetical protein